MSEFTPYQAYPSQVPDLPVGPPPVLVAVAGPAPQSRATVAFRLLLAIPHFFVLYLVSIAAEIIAFIGWWAALFTGRLPEFAVNFLTGYIRWSARVAAYCMLLTDVYPPFSLDEDPDYPAQVAIPAGQRLNPLAVLFRVILAFPASIVAGVAVAGSATIVSFIGWLITLITGRLPVAMHQAYSAVLRYQVRYNSYLLMLTAAYPSGLFGDPAGMPGWGDAWPAAGQGATPQAGFGSPESVYGTPAGYPAAPGWAQPRPAEPLASFPLMLSAAAKRLVSTFVVLGALTYAANLAIPLIAAGFASHSRTLTASEAVSAMNRSYGTLTSNLVSWRGATDKCSGNLSCVTKLDAKAATYFAAFDSQLKATSVPGNAVTAQGRLIADTDAAARDFTRLSQASSVADYQSTLQSSRLTQTLTNFDTDYASFVEALLRY